MRDLRLFLVDAFIDFLEESVAVFELSGTTADGGDRNGQKSADVSLRLSLNEHLDNLPASGKFIIFCRCEKFIK